jgi:hypothetical protein
MPVSAVGTRHDAMPSGAVPTRHGAMAFGAVNFDRIPLRHGGADVSSYSAARVAPWYVPKRQGCRAVNPFLQLFPQGFICIIKKGPKC